MSRQRRHKEFCVITADVLCKDNKRKDRLTELFPSDVILPLLVFQTPLSNLGILETNRIANARFTDELALPKNNAFLVLARIEEKFELRNIIHFYRIHGNLCNWSMRLMQDGAAGQSARTTMGLLQANRVNVLAWPSRSPDLNPIESFWMWSVGWSGEGVLEISCSYISLS